MYEEILKKRSIILSFICFISIVSIIISCIWGIRQISRNIEGVYNATCGTIVEKHIGETDAGLFSGEGGKPTYELKCMISFASDEGKEVTTNITKFVERDIYEKASVGDTFHFDTLVLDKK